MAVRFVALLIPLAITLPQLRMNIDAAPAPQEHTVPAPPASAPEWSYEMRRGADAAFTPVALESPLHGAVSSIDGNEAAAAAQAPTTPKTRARNGPAAPKAASAKTSMRAGARKAQRPLLQAACQAATHCAPVVEAKVTPVSRRSL